MRTICKLHHTTKRNVTTFNFVFINWLDLFFENVVGFGIAAALKYAVLGEGLLVPAFLLQIWTDVMCHSANPYTAAFLNPLADCIFRATIAHNLHHAVNKGYYTVIPFHHIFASERRADVEQFNKLMATSVA